METKQNISKEIVAQAIIETIEKKDKNPEIKALYVKGYETPSKIFTKGKEEKGYTPDVVYNNEEFTELYEIELNKKVDLNKWRLFSLITKRGNGNLNIVTHEEYLPHFRELLKTNSIKNVKLIYF